MNLNKLAALITKQEGKKKSLPIAQVKEVLGLVAEVIYKDSEALFALLKLGERRGTRKN